MPATHDNAGISAWNFNLRGEIHSYADAEAFMHAHGDGDGFTKLGPHMTLIEEDAIPWQSQPTYAVELYSTKIIRYYPDGTISVDNGGHATLTTKYRLDAVLPEGFNSYHHKGRLGIGRFASLRLWPLDHSKRVDPIRCAIVD